MNKRSNGWAALGIVLAAFSMRASMNAVGPLLSVIQEDLGLSASVAGLLTTIPLLIFAAVSPLAGTLAARFRLPDVMLVSLGLIVAGSLARSYLGTAGLYLGTAALGIGIGALNVMQPVVIQAGFPQKVGVVTSVYTVSMILFSALGSGLSVPLAQALGGWRNALAVWALLPLLALPVWFLLRSRGAFPRGGGRETRKAAGSVWKNTRFLMIALFMGLQSLLFFCIITWLPSIVSLKTGDTRLGGTLLLFQQMVSLVTGFLVPLLTQRPASRTPIAVASGGLYCAGLAALLFAPSAPMLILACTLLGLASGVSLSYALSLIGMSGSTAEETARLSGLAQMVGYALAAAGPVLLGAVYDAGGAWTLPILILAASSVVMLFVGIRAGRRETQEA